MDDNDDIICLDSPPSTSTNKPTTFTLKKFTRDNNSFEVKKLTRRSVSQPTLNRFAEFEEREDSNNVPLSTQAAALLSPPRKGRQPKYRSIQKEFFGVYCLISRSTNKSYKNRCYVGYTVDPNRRINQHNGGKEKGGAKKTDNRGPWEMVCIVHGFPNNVAALRFEWAWQNPEKSKAIRDLNLKKHKKETPFGFRLRIACQLMNCSPWKRFALTFRWLLPKEELPFPEETKPPVHIDKAYGLVTKSTIKIAEEVEKYTGLGKCKICSEKIESLDHLGRCLKNSCAVHFHLKCIATYGQGNEKNQQLFPVRVGCPECYNSILWGELIRDQRFLVKVAEANEEKEQLRGLVQQSLND